MTEAPWTATSQVAEPDVRQTKPSERIELIELLQAGQVAFDDTARERAVFAPLDVDFDAATIAPLSVKDVAVPEGPDVGWGLCGVITHPNELFVGWDGEGNPRAVDIIAPQEVISDNGPCGMNHGDDTLEREPFIALDV